MTTEFERQEGSQLVPKEKAIPEQIQRIQKAVAVLEERVSTLLSRLGDVSGPEQDMAGNIADPLHPVNSPIGNQLYDILRRVHRLDASCAEAIDRLEL